MCIPCAGGGACQSSSILVSKLNQKLLICKDVGQKNSLGFLVLNCLPCNYNYVDTYCHKRNTCGVVECFHSRKLEHNLVVLLVVSMFVEPANMYPHYYSLRWSWSICKDTSIWSRKMRSIACTITWRFGTEIHRLPTAWNQQLLSIFNSSSMCKTLLTFGFMLVGSIHAWLTINHRIYNGTNSPMWSNTWILVISILRRLLDLLGVFACMDFSREIC